MKLKSARLFGAATLLFGALFWLFGCAHLWQPPNPKPAVIFGPPLIEGDVGKIVVSVAYIPSDEELGAMVVEFGGFKYPAAKMDKITVVGKSGFEALAWKFSNGEGGFVLASTTGIEAGPVAEIRFRAKGKVSPAEIQIDSTKISLASAQNTLIKGFDVTFPVYYAR